MSNKEDSANRPSFVEKVDNMVMFSTGRSLKTKVIHKVIHIIHRKAGGKMVEKQDRCVFSPLFGKGGFLHLPVSAKKMEMQ